MKGEGREEGEAFLEFKRTPDPAVPLQREEEDDAFEIGSRNKNHNNQGSSSDR